MKKNKYWSAREADLLYNKQERYAESKIANQYLRIAGEVQNKVLDLYFEIIANVRHPGGINEREIIVSDLYQYQKYYEILNYIKSELVNLGTLEQKVIDQSLTQLYKDVSSQIDSKNMVSLNDPVLTDRAKLAVNAVWCKDGKNWSSRIWQAKTALAQRIEESIVDCIATGKNPVDIKREIMNDFNVSFSNADRIVRTELSYVQNKACVDQLLDEGITKYKVLNAHDEKVCDGGCLENDKKVFLVSEAKVGVNLPPFHPNCRCCIVGVKEV